jgi:hypothetical protein
LSHDRYLVLIKVKTWGYQVSALDNFLLKLFEKYAELLKRRFGDDFQEVSVYRSFYW